MERTLTPLDCPSRRFPRLPLIGWTALLVAGAISCKKPAADFMSQCTQVLSKSLPVENREWSKDFCQCTTDESKHEGVPPEVLRTEGEAMVKDPKRPFQDERLLNAFHFCVIQKMKGTF